MFVGEKSSPQRLHLRLDLDCIVGELGHVLADPRDEKHVDQQGTNFEKIIRGQAKWGERLMRTPGGCPARSTVGTPPTDKTMCG